MSDSSPARVPVELDALAAPAGRATIQLQSSLSFATDEIRDGTLAALGIPGGGGTPIAIAGTAPSAAQPMGPSPQCYGSDGSNLLGNPSAWATLTIDGTPYYLPLFTE